MIITLVGAAVPWPPELPARIISEVRKSHDCCLEPDPVVKSGKR
jgi:hypothetical protein